MKKTFLSICVVLAGLTAASAQVFTNFAVTIDVAQEVPTGGGRTGSGSGLITLDTNLNTLTFVGMSYSGLSGNSTAAHFHGPAGLGTNAGVLYNLSSFTTFGSANGTFSGTLTLVAGTGGFTIAQQLAQLQSSLWYLNIHSATFGGGEIRGQLIAVPEPSVVVLAGVGLGLLAIRRLRRR